MIEGIKRFYANVALDQDKQNSINLFLGIEGPDNIISTASAIVAGAENIASAAGNAIVNKVSPVLLGGASGESAAFMKAGNTAAGAGNLIVANSNDLEKNKERSQAEEGVEEHKTDETVKARRDYRFWFTKEYLDRPSEPDELSLLTQEIAKEDGDYWLE